MISAPNRTDDWRDREQGVTSYLPFSCHPYTVVLYMLGWGDEERGAAVVYPQN
jgi:hypothetical protein